MKFTLTVFKNAIILLYEQMINMFKTCHFKQESDLLYYNVNYMIIYSAECLSQLSEDCTDPNQLDK